MSNTQENKKQGFVLEKDNFILMGMGFAVIVFGLMLMAGGKSTDPNVFNESMFSSVRITIAPFVVLAGLVFEIYAIMKKPKTE